MNIVDYVLSAVGFCMALIVLYLSFVVLPVIFYTEAECLRKGYPASNVTIGLERYCITLDGSVIVNVKNLSQEKKGE